MYSRGIPLFWRPDSQVDWFSSSWHSFDRWYSIEYDWFYIQSLADSYRFRISPSSSGDIKDAVNYSPMDGNTWAVYTTCGNLYGPWWYTNDWTCCGCRLFGTVSGNGFVWSTMSGQKQVEMCRMMIRQIYWDNEHCCRATVTLSRADSACVTAPQMLLGNITDIIYMIQSVYKHLKTLHNTIIIIITITTATIIITHVM